MTFTKSDLLKYVQMLSFDERLLTRKLHLSYTIKKNI